LLSLASCFAETAAGQGTKGCEKNREQRLQHGAIGGSPATGVTRAACEDGHVCAKWCEGERFYRMCIVHEYLVAGLPDLVCITCVLSRFSPLLTAPIMDSSSSRTRMREHYAEIVASWAWIDLFLRELDFRL